jgi:hypothetical protein
MGLLVVIPWSGLSDIIGGTAVKKPRKSLAVASGRRMWRDEQNRPLDCCCLQRCLCLQITGPGHGERGKVEKA